MLRSGRPSTAKAEYSNAIGPSTGWRRCLTPSPWTLNVVVAPHRLELGAEPAQFVDERPTSATAPARAASARNAPTTKRATLSQSYCAARTRGSQKIRRRMLRWLGRQRAVVGQHRGRRAVPGDDVPGGGPDQRGAGLQRIEHPLQPRRDAFGAGSALRAGGRAQAGTGARARRRSASARAAIRSSTSAEGAPPRPCSSQVYQVGLILARCATSSRRRPGVRRRPPQSRRRPDRAWRGGPSGRSERILGLDALADPVSYYTMIRSLL